MTQEQKSAAWDKLMQLMDGNIVIDNAPQRRRMFLLNGVWNTVEAQKRGAMFTVSLYQGPDPLLALDALTNTDEG